MASDEQRQPLLGAPVARRAWQPPVVGACGRTLLALSLALLMLAAVWSPHRLPSTSTSRSQRQGADRLGRIEPSTGGGNGAEAPKECTGTYAPTEILTPLTYKVYNPAPTGQPPSLRFQLEIRGQTVMDREIGHDCLEQAECRLCLNAQELYDMLVHVTELEPFRTTIFPDGNRPGPSDPPPSPGTLSLCVSMHKAFGDRRARSTELILRIVCLPGCIYGQDLRVGDMYLDPEKGTCLRW